MASKDFYKIATLLIALVGISTSVMLFIFQTKLDAALQHGQLREEILDRTLNHINKRLEYHDDHKHD